MPLYKMISKDLCIVELEGKKKLPVIEEIAARLKNHSAFADIPHSRIVEGFMARENLGSTGFGNGLAIPHCKLPELDRFFVGLAISKKGVNFDSFDGKKTNIFCFIIGPDNDPETHVKILAEVSSVLREDFVRRELMAAKSQTALYEEFLRHSTPEDISDGSLSSKLVMIVIQREEHLLEIMELFIELGIKGASISESNGMGQFLSKVPLFADFVNFLGQTDVFHRTIWALVPQNNLELLVASIEKITGDFNRHSGTMILALDVAFIKGSMETI